ncbi:MAG: hypothetical protein K2O60_03360 [Ruminococcus sp.]|nr:hypothetical protein [Ruminococcus sp.]
MKISLPFKYIVSTKRDKYYVVFDFKDDNGKRQRRWVGTGLPVKCAKKVLNEKVDELVAQFYKDYCSGKATKPREKINKNTKNAKFLSHTLSGKVQRLNLRSFSYIGLRQSSLQSLMQLMKAIRTLFARRQNILTKTIRISC